MKLQNDWRFSLERVSYNTITHLNFFWIIMPHFLLGMGRCYWSYMLKSMKQTSLSLSNCFKNSNVILSWSVSLDWCYFFSTKSINLYLHSILPKIKFTIKIFEVKIRVMNAWNKQRASGARQPVNIGIK